MSKAQSSVGSVPFSVRSDGVVVSSASLVTAIFAATLFLSAALLFTLEPMFAKMVLPRLGGSPAVWNTCVVFFQAAMLAGYAYAHLTSTWLSLRNQAAFHLALILAAGLTLPIMISEGWAPAVDDTPIPSLLLLLMVSLGGPFFVVSSTAPLMQKWYSETDRTSAADPYFLYSASNMGSIVALVAYPFVVEPLWSLSAQRWGWTVAYLGFAILTMLCGVAAIQFGGVLRKRALAHMSIDEQKNAGISWSCRTRWLILAFIPSSLLLGVTTFLSTDVAAMPLLWTIPLALYLLTFVIAFTARPLIPARFARGIAVTIGPILVFAILVGLKDPVWLLIPLHLAGFFASALTLHCQLARERPTSRYLTEFYLWIAVGGLIGGTFNTIVAPLVFSSVVEYPLALALAVAVMTRSGKGAQRFRTADIALPLALGITVTALLLAFKNGTLGTVVGSLGVGLVGVMCAACAKRPLRLGCGLALVVLGANVVVPRGADLLYAERTFFGVLRVTADNSGRQHSLFHGSTLHGQQSRDSIRHNEPLTYYHQTGPIGQVIGALSHRLERVAVVGLGAGSLAAYAEPGQRWTFYEIDPAVERIARTPALFTYIDDCGEKCDIVIGDARLSLGRTGMTYDLIALDAFSSDAIPAHLLTREALALYLSRLSHDGVIAFHISNRYLDLRPVVGALAAERGLVARVQVHSPTAHSGAKPSMWVVVARTAKALGPLATDMRWNDLATRSDRVWTDDYSDILTVLKRP
jgi:spermidine synthase